MPPLPRYCLDLLRKSRQQKLLVNQVCAASNAADLRSALAEKIPQVQEEVKAFRKTHGNTKVKQ